ncbi:LysR substrate-binding domain-containing protein [uncultured Roseobacter sp.]|uniref:LysR substrate-binding domain-containing protein n=1 Tax=uncultured Roseobacter sp. TaxID=114847 RepID=UPI00260DFB70|nr:LysR substrate-binding domain-containing protein [uncultured Roseobacter sp.]
MILTETGRRLLPVAMDVTARLDATLRSIANPPVEGKLSLGIPDDHGREKLAQIVADFSRDQPGIELNVTCSLSAGFPEALRRGALDLAIYEVEAVSPSEELLIEDPTCWVSSAERDFTDVEPLPVALFDEACWWRDAAIASLEAQGRPYRIVYSSQSVLGVLAAVRAGMAIGLLGRSSLDAGLLVLTDAMSFGPTPTSKLVMKSKGAARTDAIDAMRQTIRRAFHAA